MSCNARSRIVAVRLGFLLVAVLSLSTFAAAQTVNAGFHGTVADSSGAVLPGAKVEVKNLATNLVREATSSDVGFYTITQLPPGHYTVTASKEGFAAARQADVELLVNQDAELNFSLQVGAVTTQVEVTAAPPLMQTATATIGQATTPTPSAITASRSSTAPTRATAFGNSTASNHAVPMNIASSNKWAAQKSECSIHSTLTRIPGNHHGGAGGDPSGPGALGDGMGNVAGGAACPPPTEAPGSCFTAPPAADTPPSITAVECSMTFPPLAWTEPVTCPRTSTPPPSAIASPSTVPST